MSVAIPANDFLSIYQSMQYDHPELFWIDNAAYSYYQNNQGIVTTAMLQYNDLASNASFYYEYFHNTALSYCQNAIQHGDSKIDQIKYINDIMCNTITYQLNSPYSQTAYSSLQLTTTVCAGYSKGFQYCMQLLGIPTTYMVGYAGGLHAWNLVELDGEYYNMDVTWNDPYPTPGQYDYSYFNITDSQIVSDHQRIDISATLPPANGTKYSYDNFYDGNNNGTDFTDYQAIDSVSVTDLATQVQTILDGNGSFIDNTLDGVSDNIAPGDSTAEQPSSEEPAPEETTTTQPENEDDNFDWDAYYEELDAWEAMGGTLPSGLSDGTFDEALDDYLYYDSDYEVFYYYDYDMNTYVGYDADSWYYWDLDCWYYWE